MTNFRSLLKHQIHYKINISCIEGNFSCNRLIKLRSYTCMSFPFCRTGYYTAYRQVYSMDVHRVTRCCPGWTQRGKERGCLHREFKVKH
jgi:hypothetical protein